MLDHKLNIFLNLIFRYFMVFIIMSLKSAVLALIFSVVSLAYRTA